MCSSSVLSLNRAAAALPVRAKKAHEIGGRSKAALGAQRKFVQPYFSMRSIQLSPDTMNIGLPCASIE